MQRNGKSDVSIVHGKNHSRIRTIDADVSIARTRVPSRRSIDTRSKLFLFLEYLSKIASVRDSRFNLDQLEETFRRRIVFESTIAIKVHPLDKPSKLSRHPAWNIQRSHSRLLPDWSFRASRSTLRAKIHDSPYNGTLPLLSPSRFFASRYREREREGDFIRALPLSYTANKFAYSKRGVRDIPRRSENEQQIEIYEKRENLWLRDFRLGGVNVRKERLEGPWHAVSC